MWSSEKAYFVIEEQARYLELLVTSSKDYKNKIKNKTIYRQYPNRRGCKNSKNEIAQHPGVIWLRNKQRNEKSDQSSEEVYY